MHWDLLSLLLEWGFALAMLVSAALDLRARRLPNWLNLAVALGFLPWAWVKALGWNAFAIHAGVGAAVLGLGFALFAAGVIGGGDAKLGAAVALWIGFSFDLLRFFLVMSFAGGILAVCALIWQAATHRQLTRALPYGVAIGVAGLDFWLRHSQAACSLSAC
ncbi:MAG TPA: prepilin peptidase [Dongiaceae bacterium]|jgi:prepilin peptidase CpaA|nr:prepilin peptidase [Dongiaceae bacterium]